MSPADGVAGIGASVDTENGDGFDSGFPFGDFDIDSIQAFCFSYLSASFAKNCFLFSLKESSPLEGSPLHKVTEREILTRPCQKPLISAHSSPKEEKDMKHE